MKKNKFYSTVLVIAMIAILGGCAKDGATGPVGPAGVAGANGNANVTSVQSTVQSWIWDGQNDWIDMSYPQISSDFLQKGGIVEVFVLISSGPNGEQTWAALPYSMEISPGVTQTVSYYFALNSNGGIVTFMIHNSNGQQPVITNPITFKITFIAGS